MSTIRELGNVDIYVLDQLIKGNIHQDQRLLDAGCGSGRNFSYFAKHNYNITGIDPDEEHIGNLHEQFPNLTHKLILSSIENYPSEEKFDYIICNAVLHFSTDHCHFNQMFDRLVSLLNPSGTLFIRMTTSEGMFITPNENGISVLPDESTRYLVSREQISNLCDEYELELGSPFKTTLVENWRSMATIIIQKRPSTS